MSALAVRKSEFAVHQLGEDDDRVVLSSDALEALLNRVGRGSAEAVVVDVQAVGEGEEFLHRLGGFRGRRAVLEGQLAEAGLDDVRGEHRLRDRVD